MISYFQIIVAFHAMLFIVLLYVAGGDLILIISFVKGERKRYPKFLILGRCT